MLNKIFQPEVAIEPTSYLWHRLFMENSTPATGTVIEVAPGYEPKIGRALALMGFCGTLFVIEPDHKAANHIHHTYQRLLPQATVCTIHKPLHMVTTGADVPYEADVLVASHPFDDMVMALMVNNAHFFSQEQEGGTTVSPIIKNFYDTLRNEQYASGIRTTTATWKRFIKKSRPHYFIASQYPSHMLTVKGLMQRQYSGFAVLEQLKQFYKSSLIEHHHEQAYGFKGDPRWWIVVREPCKNVLP